MKRLITCLLPLILNSCTSFSDVEKQALYDRAIADARNQPKVMHLAYLQCYALKDVDKKICEGKIRRNIEGIKDSSFFEYLRPFDYEMERLGFAEFIRSHNKKCSSVNEGPQFNEANQAYNVKCSDGQNYNMQFNYKNNQWSIL